MTLRPDIVGDLEIAERLGVKRDTVHQWRKRRVLPDPDGYISGGTTPWWRWRIIEQWARLTGRLKTPQPIPLHQEEP